MHSAAYPEDLDLQGKRVALIGGGSSGIQILPQIQKQAKVVHHYTKDRTWNPTAGIGGEGLAKRGGDRKLRAAEKLPTQGGKTNILILKRKRLSKILSGSKTTPQLTENIVEQ